MIKRKEILSILNAPCGKNYFDTFNYSLVCESVKKLYELLKDENYYIVYDYSNISKRQYNEAMAVLKSLQVADIRNAYHSLWDTIDNMGLGQDENSYISMTEHLLLCSIIQNFVMYIDYQNDIEKQN